MWQNGYQTKTTYCDVNEINQHLEYCKKYRQIIYSTPAKSRYDPLCAYIDDRLKYFDLLYTIGGQRALFRFVKDGMRQTEKIAGEEAFRCLNLYYKVPRLNQFCDKSKADYMSASPFLWYNKRYEGQRVQAWEYDQNSAYSAAMLKPMPDTSVPMRSGIIEKGKEVGYIELPKDKDANSMRLAAIYEGFSEYIFPLMPSPFGGFVKTWYAKKQDPKTKDKAKGVLNYAIGYLQICNVFLRASILTYCEDYIKSCMDENTIYCNTDSIVSLKPRPDLDIGDGVGQWKCDAQGDFAFVGFNYQWGKEPPTYRGVPKSWFPRGWDILKDEIPHFGNLYYFDKAANKIKQVKKCNNGG